jgi:hypothetical protein
MNSHYPTLDEPATPEYVLAVMREAYRINVGIAYEEAARRLMPNTTIAEWLNQFDGLALPDCGPSLNEMWSLYIPMLEWRDLLASQERTRFGGLCEVIAEHAVRTRIQPARLFGTVDRPAGVFLSIRSLMRDAGIDVAGILPSTPVAPYMPQLCDMVGMLCRLSPGALPVLHWSSPRVEEALYIALAAAAILIFIALISGSASFGLTGFVSLVLSVLALRIYCRDTDRLKLEFEGIRTFRDLATALSRDAVA